jgi:NAD-dependent SIR2 family protein deacetylase
MLAGSCLSSRFETAHILIVSIGAGMSAASGLARNGRAVQKADERPVY